MKASYFPQRIAIAVMLGIACLFAGNHIAARIAFDDGAGLILAIISRAGMTMLVLLGLLLWRREFYVPTKNKMAWQILLGVLIGLQSFCIYSAVMRIPVGLTLLVVNLAPVFFVLYSWAMGGSPPSRRALALMSTILVGLLVALEVPVLVSTPGALSAVWLEGVIYSLVAAVVFAGAMWITENRLALMPGLTRSFLTVAVVCLLAVVMAASEIVPGTASFPATLVGWTALLVLTLLYAVAFSTLFICMPRLNIARNAPAMNFEPVAGLALGWVILGQSLTGMQLFGSLLVVVGIVLLAYYR